jgi:hypothetical protein
MHQLEKGKVIQKASSSSVQKLTRRQQGGSYVYMLVHVNIYILTRWRLKINAI